MEIKAHLSALMLSGFIQVPQISSNSFQFIRSMRRARDVREQIEGLMTRVEVEMTSNPLDDVEIRKVCR